ncbi:MAG: cyclase family protein, partial [Candidatus Caldatribacteriaceae bacterium]
MEIVDLTLPIFSGCPTFPGQAQVVVFSWHDISLHEYRTNALFFMDHTGTHVDVPAHFLPEGKTVEEMGLDRFMGKTITIDLSPLVGKGVVDLPEFKNLFLPEKGTEEGAIVLLYTGMDALFGKREYFEKEIGISEEVAQFLVERKIKGVGIDAPSID